MEEKAPYDRKQPGEFILPRDNPLPDIVEDPAPTPPLPPVKGDK